MSDQDLSILDETKPNGATEEVAVLDEYQRETRTKLKAWAGVEHDLVTGAHVIPHGTTAPTGTDGSLFYHEIQRELIVNSGGAWRSTAQPTFNYIINGMLTQFYRQPTNTFVGWGLYGAGAAINQVGEFAYGPNTGYMTRSGDYSAFFQQIANSSGAPSPFGPYTYWRGKTVTFGMLVYCNMPNSVYLELGDNIGSAVSARHPGDSQWHWLTVTRMMSYSTTIVQVQILLAPPATETYFSGATLVEGHSCPHPLPSGWQGRQGVLHFGHGDNQPIDIPWYYGTGGYSVAEWAVRAFVPFDAYVHNLSIFSSSIPAAGVAARVIYNGGDTPIAVSITGSPNQGHDFTNACAGGKGGGWSIRVYRSIGSNVGSFSGSLIYEEIPRMY